MTEREALTQAIREQLNDEMMARFEQEKRLKRTACRQQNAFIQKGRTLFTGSSLMEQFPITEFCLNEGLPTAYNRGIGGYTTDEFLEAIDDERRRRDVERKAGEIGMKTAAKLLEGLPALGVGCEYDVDGGTVHLDLTRMLTASLDIPLEELAAFVSDPGKILSVLSPAEAAAPCPAYREQHPFRWPPYGQTGGRRH